MKRLPLVLLCATLGLMVSCGKGGSTPSPAAPGLPGLPGAESAMPGIQHPGTSDPRELVVEPADDPQLIDGRFELSGSATLMGGVGSEDPEVAPLTVRLGGGWGSDASILTLRATTLSESPGELPPLGVRLRTAVGSYSVHAFSTITLPRDGAPLTFRHHFRIPGRASLELVNAAEPTGEPFAEPVKIDWNWTRLPTGDALNRDGTSGSDRLYTELARDGLLCIGLIDVPEDDIDDYRVMLQEGSTYELQVDVNNGTGDDWNYWAEIAPLLSHSSAGDYTSLIPTTNDTQATGSFVAPTTGQYRVRINGVPVNPDGPSPHLLHYRLRWTVDEPPAAISGLPPASGVWGASGDIAEWELSLAEDERGSVLWNLPYSERRSPSTQVEKFNTSTRLRYRLPAPGDYEGSVLIFDAKMQTTRHDFEFTVTEGRPWIDVRQRLTIPAYENPMTLELPVTGEVTSAHWEVKDSQTVWTSDDLQPFFAWPRSGDNAIKVILGNSHGEREFVVPVKFTAPANRPAITDISPAPSLVPTGSQLTLAVVTDATPIAWEWSFNDHISPRSSAAATPTITANDSGYGWASVRIRNADGWSIPKAVTFEIRSANPVEWHTASFMPPGYRGESGSLRSTLVGDRLIILAERQAMARTDVYSATPQLNVAPEEWAWTCHQLPLVPGVKTQSIKGFEAIDGRLLLLLEVKENAMAPRKHVVMTTDVAAPASSSDWAVHWLPGQVSSKRLALAVRHGRPLIMQTDPVQLRPQFYLLEATSTTPRAQGDWIVSQTVIPWPGDMRKLTTAYAVAGDVMGLALPTSDGDIALATTNSSGSLAGATWQVGLSPLTTEDGIEQLLLAPNHPADATGWSCLVVPQIGMSQPVGCPAPRSSQAAKATGTPRTCP